MRSFTDASELVADLLDRLESRGASTRLLAHVDYHGFDNIDRQDECVEALNALERTGGVTLKRLRKDGVEQIVHVRLNDAGVLYRHLGRTPASQSATKALSALRARGGMPGAFGDLLDDVQSAWSRNVSWNMLRPGQAEALNDAVDLAVALAGRATDLTSSVIDYRSFSRRVVGDSKSLEKLATVVVTLLRRLYPELAIDADLDDRDILASLGVERLPQPLLVSGNVSIDGHALGDMPYFGVPPESAHRLTFSRPVVYLLTIENFTSFIRHAREVDDGKAGVVLYTGGFPARAILRAIVDIAHRAQAPVFHWGDIDPGGLRIFVHIERALRERGMSLEPHLMSIDILHRHGRPGDRTARRLSAGKAEASSLASLWDMMAGAGAALELEQEALEPISPLS